MASDVQIEKNYSNEAAVRCVQNDYTAFTLLKTKRGGTK